MVRVEVVFVQSPALNARKHFREGKTIEEGDRAGERTAPLRVARTASCA